MKNIVEKIIMFVGFAITIVGLCLCAVDDDLGSIMTTMAASNVMALLALTFIFAKNNVVKNTGYGLAAINGVSACGLLKMWIDNEQLPGTLMVIVIGLLVMFAAAILYTILVCIRFFGYEKVVQWRGSDKCYDKINRFKKMEEDGILTESEFSAAKTRVLNALTDQEISIDELKNWKKLLDENIITEEEFVDVKAKAVL